MQVPAWLPRAAPGRPALVTAEGTLSYGELLAGADSAARRLAALGAAPGDRVALALAPGRPFVESLHGCWRLGAVPVPLDLRLTDAERDVQANGALVVDGPLGLADRDATGPPLREELDLDGVAAVVHTSGSGGTPKPVELTFGNFLWSAVGSAVALGLDPGERWLSALPLSHVGGLSIVVRSAIYGTTAVVQERFEPDRTAAALADATIVSVVPTMLARLLDTGLSAPERLRCALVGGGPVPPELAERATAAGIPLAQTYGLTEACSQVTTSAIGEPGTAGAPLFCTRVETAPDGELLVRGPTVAPAAGPVLRTGDLGTLDEECRLTVQGRKADTIVSGGENVSPAEVEAALEAHPAVAEAAVVGRPDPEWGEAVTALVVVRDGMNVAPDDLRAQCRERLAGFKVPKSIEQVSELPRTPSGKLLRAALR